MRLRITLVGVGVAVLVSIAFAFLLYQPRVREQQELNAEALTLQGEQSSLQASIGELVAVRADETQINADLDRLRSLVPDGAAQPEAIRQLQQVADAAGVEMHSVSFATPVAADPVVPVGTDQQVGVITTTVELRGEYFQSVDFLRRLEVESTRAILVDNLVMGEGEGSFPTLSSTLTGRLLALIPIDAPPPGTVAAPDAAAATDPNAAPTGTPAATEGTTEIEGSQ
jgi:Tfp pilus assembly protein PilO